MVENRGLNNTEAGYLALGDLKKKKKHCEVISACFNAVK